ncbi:unnamed protein product [Paramecium pentaurelia]|uniref:Uncharacterized protein n=1 Tax=Paramecium pentaurelia TaxID=43138 RepID=A0A8S1Y2L1_9CILI|nr:unnamed protein product [Paramecium pentaurelia]
MHSNNICEYHNKKIELICINNSCQGADSLLCQNCLKFDFHLECKEKNQILPQDQFFEVMKTALKEKMEGEDVLVLNLKETIENLQLLYEETKIDADSRKDRYFKLKQKVKKFSYYKHAKYLQQIKQATSFNEINFDRSQQENRTEKSMLKYIAEIDNSIQSIKNILNKKNNELQEQQQQQQQQSRPLKSSIFVFKGSKSSQIFSQNEIEDLQQKSQFKQIKELQKKSDTIEQQKLRNEIEDNQQQIVSKNEGGHLDNNQIMQQFINQQQPQLQQHPESNIISQVQNTFTEPDKNQIKQQVNQQSFHLPQYQINYPQVMSAVNFQHLNSDLVLHSKNKIASMINPSTNNMYNQSVIKKSKFEYKLSFANKFANQPITKIEIIDNKNLIYLSEQKLVFITEYKSKSNNKKLEKNFQVLILDFQILNQHQILVHTSQSLILLDKNLEILKIYKKIIEKNHLTIDKGFKIDIVSISAVCYLQDSNQLIGCQIIKNDIVEQWQKQYLAGEKKIISMKVIKDNLFIGYQNGEIIVYELKTLNKQQSYQIQINLSKDISAILFDEKFCLGIQENNLYRLNYDNETKLLCSSKHRIITCAYYINDEKNKAEIHLLLENHKIHIFHKKDDQVDNKYRVKNGITCVSCFLDIIQPKFVYGERDGGIFCDYHRDI